MTKYLLDTNILSEVRKKDRANKSVLSWFLGTKSESLFTSVLVIGEIRRGIESKRRRDIQQAEALDLWLEGLIQNFHNRIFPIDDPVADCWGRLSIDQKLPDIDGLLAATAIVHNLTLVTRNTDDFERSGVKLFDPFQ